MKKMLINLMFCMVMFFVAFALLGCETVSFDEYKASVLTELQNYADAKGQNNYTIKGWELIQIALEGGKNVIEDKLTKTSIKKAYNNAKEEIDAVMPNPISIHYHTNENWVHWQDHKYYDFVNNTYSTKRILVDYEGGKPFTVIDKEYTIVATFTEEEQIAFFDSIRERGIFNLDEWYQGNAEDADSWYLTITFRGGTVLKSGGYSKFPSQKEALDEVFITLCGYKLFEHLLDS
ncbi:MAG TPA: hypothetical protein GX708_17555 [Gallicola sp.]|jgi:hypothetical protein|nr:hypothetical protein [Gallicola sp.]